MLIVNRGNVSAMITMLIPDTPQPHTDVRHGAMNANGKNVKKNAKMVMMTMAQCYLQKRVISKYVQIVNKIMRQCLVMVSINNPVLPVEVAVIKN